MGFGSYDESEQQNQPVSSDEDEDVEVDDHGQGHGGESTFEMDGSADDMLDQLEEIKANAEDAEDDD